VRGTHKINKQESVALCVLTYCLDMWHRICIMLSTNVPSDPTSRLLCLPCSASKCADLVTGRNVQLNVGRTHNWLRWLPWC